MAGSCLYHRLGVLLVVDPEEEGGEVGVALTRGFSYLVEHKSPREALKWLYQRVRLLMTSHDIIHIIFGVYTCTDTGSESAERDGDCGSV